MNETVRQIADAAGLNVRFVRIPREVLEKRAVEQGDIRFFELAALSVDVDQKGRDIRLTLTDFMVPPDDVPEEVIKAVKHWSEWIDYWAVDFNYREDTDVRNKDRAACIWAEGASDLTGQQWQYVKVLQKTFNDLQPVTFEDCAYMGAQQSNMFDQSG